MLKRSKVFAAISAAALLFSATSMVHAEDSSNIPSGSSAGPTTNLESWGSHKSSGYGERTHINFQGHADGHFFPTNSLGTAANKSAVLTNQGGPVIASPTIYTIYYGNWGNNPCGASDNSTPGVINKFLINLGSSQWYKTNTTYYQINKNGSYTFIQPNLTPGPCVKDPGSVGSIIDTDNTNGISKIVLNNIPAFGTDLNGIYLVLTSADMKQAGFTTSFCGYHSFETVTATTNLFFASVGDSGSNKSCLSQTSSSPNSNISADSMASVIAHEIVETTSDPLGTTWWDNRRTGYENGDACAWVFGTTYTGTNNAKANTNAGGFDYYLQENLPAPLASTTVSSGCLSELPTSAPTINSVSLNSASPGMAVTITGTNFASGTSATVVGFGGIYAVPSAVTSTSLTVTVPTSAKSGPLHVVTAAGVALASSPITIIVPVTQPTLVISNTNLTNLPAGTAVPLTISGGSGAGVVSFTTTGTGCAVNSSSLNVTSAPATCVVTAKESASTGYLAATSATQTFKFVAIAQSPQLALTPSATALTKGTPITLGTTGGQGTGTVSYSVTNSTSCKLTSSGGITSLTVPTTVKTSGSCTVTATKAASTIYLSSISSVTHTY
jgi:hypothetical protein